MDRSKSAFMDDLKLAVLQQTNFKDCFIRNNCEYECSIRVYLLHAQVILL